MNQKQLKDSLAIAEHYFQSSNYKYAETILKGVIAIDVANIKANELLAYIYENQGNIELAYHFYDVACADINANQELLYNHASIDCLRHIVDCEQGDLDCGEKPSKNKELRKSKTIET